MPYTITPLSLLQRYQNLHASQKAGLILLSILVMLLGSKTYNATSYAFYPSTSPMPTSASQHTDPIRPTFITIPSIEVALPIDEGTTNLFEWKRDSKRAWHLKTSATPGENGNIILYAANSNAAFGRISQLEKNDLIIIITQDGEAHHYRITGANIVSPFQSNILEDSDHEKATLYTSYGFGNLQRFIIQAEPTK